MLDTLRKWPRKFYCINDNTDPEKTDENEVVRAVLRDYFDSVLPIPSIFELDPRYRNRYLHIKELKYWMFFRSILTLSTWTCVLVAVLLLVLYYFNIDIDSLRTGWSSGRTSSTLALLCASTGFDILDL